MFCPDCASPLPGMPPVGCTACGAQIWLDPKPCAGAAVTRGNTLLLVRRAHEPWRGFWDVPGGFCEPGEHPIQTAERELREETGLRVRVTGFLGIWPDRYETPGATPILTLNIYYHAQLVEDGVAKPDPREVAELRWCPADQLPTSVAFPGHIVPLLQAWRAALNAGELETSLFDRPA